MSEAAIAARKLVKRYGGVTALRGIDLEVPRGATLAVLGPNGAGKSTLLRLLAGLARPSSGELRVAGQRADRRSARARIGFVGHTTFLYPALTARENLVFAARLYGVSEPAERADRLLEDEGLTRVAERPVGTFSRGMAQRLAIARALVHEPEVVVLDEPFTGLDRAAARRLAARLQGLRGGGRTTVLVTHEVEQAAALADRVIVLARGRIAHAACGAEAKAASLEAAYQRAADAP